jgi:hypothetical protein
MRIAAVLLALAPLLARGEAGPSGPSQAVRGYFRALDQQDFGKAVAMTSGTALMRTASMVAMLRQQAAAYHARVEIKVRALDVRSPGEPDERGVPVPVQFHIDVVGKRWCFSRVARRLAGEARFYVDPAHPDKIVAIEGNID